MSRLAGSCQVSRGARLVVQVVTSPPVPGTIYVSGVPPKNRAKRRASGRTRANGALARDRRPSNRPLRYARERAALSRRELAAGTESVSVSALCSYEAARRHPSPATVIEILEAMQMDTATMNMVVDAAGYGGELADRARFLCGQPVRGRGQGKRHKGESRTFDAIQREIDGHHWLWPDHQRHLRGGVRE